MSTSALSERVATALLPRNEHRPVEIGVIAYRIAQVIDRTRYTDISLVDAISGFLAEHRIALPAGRTVETLTDAIMQRVFADTVYDSELNQALRATTPVLAEAFPSRTILAAGWIPGHQVIRRWERHTLTGQACPQCEMNPETYGPGGGTRCLDTAGCGWWYCA